MLDPKGRMCDQKYASSTRSSNPGIHIITKHPHCKSLIASLEALEQGSVAKKRARDESKVVELPSKVIKLNKMSTNDDQTKIESYASFDGSSLRAELNEAIALMISVHSLPMRFVESTYLQTVMDLYRRSARHVKKLDSRQHIIKCEHELFQSIKHTVNLSLRSSAYPITLAFDGWQNTNHLHVQNIMALTSSSTVFLKSDLSKDRATAEVLFPFIESVVDELIDDKIEIGGIVADNASVNGKIARMMQSKYPWILTLPCASHTLQLCIVRLFEQDSVAYELKDIVRQIVKAIGNSNIRLNEFLRVQGEAAVHLTKPQKTRWSSYHRACKAVLKLKPFVELALRRNTVDDDHPILSQLSVTFWNNLADIVAFLDPFSVASDIIQSDYASLLDVHTQFSTLYQHCLDTPLSLTHGASVMQVAIQQHWKKNINQKAVFMVSQFAYENKQFVLFDDCVKVDAPDWFFGWAAQLWVHHESLHDPTSSQFTAAERASHVQEICVVIENQYSSFLSNQFPYSRIKIQIETNRPAVDINNTTSKFAPFDVLTPWLRLEKANLGNGKELIHGVVTLLSLNCSEASVERGFSLQKLTHSLLMNRKLQSTVERQMYIKSNHRVMRRSKANTRASMRSTSLDDDIEFGTGPNEYGSDTDVEVFDSTDDEIDSDVDLEVNASDPVSQRMANNQPSPSSSHSQSPPSSSQPASSQSQPPLATARRAYVRANHSVLAPPRRAWTMVDELTLALDDFCKAYIALNQLRLPSPFADRGASKLRAAMEADPTVAREQPTDAQRHIIFLLEKAEPAANAVHAET